MAIRHTWHGREIPQPVMMWSRSRCASDVHEQEVQLRCFATVNRHQSAILVVRLLASTTVMQQRHEASIRCTVHILASSAHWLRQHFLPGATRRSASRWTG